MLLAVITALIVLFEGEGLRLVGMAGPELVTWLGMFDAAAVLDLAAVTLTVAATTRFRALRDRLLLLAGRTVAAGRVALGLGQDREQGRGRQRARRDRPTAPRPTRSDDPDPATGVGYAFG